MNIEDKLNNIGINLRKDNGEIKTYSDILEEMSEVWRKDNLSRYIEFYCNSTNLKVYNSRGEIYSEKYEWGKFGFWIDEAVNIILSRKLSLKEFNGVSEIHIGDSGNPFTTIIFGNGVEIYAENQSPPWAVEENNKILCDYFNFGKG